VLSLGVLAVLHRIALAFYLYWQWPWLDIAMHFFGGAVVALGLFTIRDFVRQIPDRLEYLLPVMSGVVVVVLVWELFEFFVVGIPLTTPGIELDTAIDITVGIIGGLVGFFVGHSLRRL
jgi:uncharacterized membrane protein YeaQ/YmgE (transglycosylase-associated protein family)